MNVDRQERAKQRLRSTLEHVENSIRLGGDDAHPLDQLRVAETELRKMLTALEHGTAEQHRTSGLWRMITDSWPLRDDLGEEIVTAEREFDLLVHPRR